MKTQGMRPVCFLGATLIAAGCASFENPHKIEASAIGLDAILVGEFGIPLGEVFEVEGTAVPDPERGLPKQDRSSYLRVSRVNGQPLAEPKEIWVDGIGGIPSGVVFRLRVDEDARLDVSEGTNRSMNSARYPARQRLATFLHVLDQLSPERPRLKESNEGRAVFLKRMQQVQAGWSEKQMLELAGEPTHKEGDSWYYGWIENRLGGLHEIYRFTMKEGSVARIEHSLSYDERVPRSAAK